MAIHANEHAVSARVDPARGNGAQRAVSHRALSLMHQVLATPGEPLDAATREYLQPRLHQDFSHVRVHSDSPSAESARSLSARAYAVGPHIVFGPAQYQPRTATGCALIAHELAHVTQHGPARATSAGLAIAPPSDGAEREADAIAESVMNGASISDASVTSTRSVAVHRKPVEPDVAPASGSETAPGAVAGRLDFAALAMQIYKAIEGLGTDEEAVYRALQKLERDQEAIERLKEEYRRMHPKHVTLLEDIYDDFSGTELEYALQLLNLGSPQSKQRIAAAPEDVRAAAARLRAAFQGPGTDEEAAYAALLPYRRDTLKVQRAYQEAYQEDLRDRIEDEMSGSELAYALELLETPFERYVQEANSWLKRFPAIGFGLPWARDDWFDQRFWRREYDPAKKEFMLVLKSGLPHQAIDALFHEQGRWHVDCAVFVEVVQLYALRQSLGASRFDRRIGSRMELRAHGSTGVRRHVLFKRATHREAFAAHGDAAEPVGAVDELVAQAPVGSRVRWTSELLFERANNLFGPEVFTIAEQEWPAWQHENTVKLGPDRFGAHGISGRSASRAEIEAKLADVTADVLPEKPKSEIRDGIFISEIELFEPPERGDRAGHGESS